MRRGGEAASVRPPTTSPFPLGPRPVGVRCASMAGYLDLNVGVWKSQQLEMARNTLGGFSYGLDVRRSGKRSEISRGNVRLRMKADEGLEGAEIWVVEGGIRSLLTSHSVRVSHEGNPPPLSPLLV